MSYDATGRLKDMMFDSKAGMFVAASKKLGFNEHFYGLGKKPRLDKRRSSFVNWNSDTPGYTKERIRSIKPSRFTSDCSLATLTGSFSTTAIAAISTSANRRNNVHGSALKAAR